MALSPELKVMVSKSKTAHEAISTEDFMSLLDDRRDAMMKAIAEFDDAVEGLQAIARLTPPDEPGVMDFGEEAGVVDRLVRATRALKQRREAEAS